MGRSNHCARLRVNLGVAAVLTLACTRTADEPLPALQARNGALGLGPEQAEMLRAPTTLRGLPPAHGVGGHVLDVQPDPARGGTGPQAPTSEYLRPVDNASVSQDDGQALQDALDAFSSSEVANYGVALLTAEQLIGTEENEFQDGLCEDPGVFFDFEEDGTDYAASYQVPRYFYLFDQRIAAKTTLSATCQSALAAEETVADAVASGDCLLSEEREFFPEGSACRECLEDTADYDGCVTDLACADEADLQVWFTEDDGTNTFYDVLYGTIWSCAPDWTSLVMLLVHRDDDGALPVPWDHANWSFMCMPFWDEAIDDANWYCDSGAEGPARGSTLAAGASGYVRYIREQSATSGEPWKDRLYYADYIDLGTSSIDWMWAYNPGIGAVSLDVLYEDTNDDGTVGPGDLNFGFEGGYSWGMNPNQLRPDGETEVRDFIAVETMKASTGHSGLYASASNHNRCNPDSWTGPFADGTFACGELLDPEAGWLNDVNVAWMDASFSSVYAYPQLTLASTGLPDPRVPGGHVIQMTGSPNLANPDWEACEYPDTFIPDVASFPAVPDTSAPGPLTGQVYRFGKDEDLDIRALFYANPRRHYCPGDGE